jgi:hypothetical protein
MLKRNRVELMGTLKSVPVFVTLLFTITYKKSILRVVTSRHYCSRKGMNDG